MINKRFVDVWSEKYDKSYRKGDSQLEQQIRDKLERYYSRSGVKYITKDILYDIVHWKSPRIIRHARNNRGGFVREVTMHCFSSSDEQFKVEGLTIMKGVEYRVATAILYFCYPSKYTIMDYRAWWTLQDRNEMPQNYGIKDDFEHWEKYLNICREVSKRCNCDLRKLDKALWQYSKENQRG